ncbi:MAG: zinc metallopeptidase [Bacteroidota bacterium]|nr:zinc metallopeptidase [Bacteroidota bacterium]MDX5404954.1 zinc metallopeptidase [Bacteroidota bacterium]MDX5427316.1 zinc metallopeptidase [Bacteroidota bacterium]MDX5447953.1 zinc metallopeptidase [Bacteroidota bacterium]MDX5505267.1 zinc metallopeptidase [Bacteroidota bacterium]
MLFIILIAFAAIGFFVQMRLRSKFEEYGKLALSSGMSGAEVAEKMLHDNGIYDVKITSVPGKLSDHYNPVNKTVNLSPDVYSGRSVAAAAVAAHECGHAVQHAKAYKWLQFRSAMVPIVQFSSQAMGYIFMFLLFGVFIVSWFPMREVFLAMIILQAVLTAFAFVTLPVEYDASNRALAWLNTAGITNTTEHDKAADALKWAARTYLVSALASLTTLAYYILLFMGGSRD